MKLSKEDERYSKQMGIAGMLYDCEPRGFGNKITAEEKNALNVYYFAGRDVDVDDMFTYSRRIARENPAIVALARSALHKVARLYKIDEGEIKEMFGE